MLIQGDFRGIKLSIKNDETEQRGNDLHAYLTAGYTLNKLSESERLAR